MAIIRTNNGKEIDMGKLIQGNRNQRAVGNMNVNAQGDVIGAGGEVIKKNEERVREYYKNNPRSSTSNQSLKGEMPKLKPDNDKPVPKGTAPKTAQTAKENKRTATKKAAPAPEPVVEPDEFDAPMEPLGYNEVEMPNGDIEMVPYYREEDKK